MSGAAFSYSDDAWSRVRKELPAAADLEVVRLYLEIIISSHRLALDVMAEDRWTIDAGIRQARRQGDNRAVAYLESMKRGPGKRKNVSRNFLLETLVNLWQDAGGVVRAGNDREGGPLARFLINAAAPVYTLTPSAARAFLRKRI